MRLYVFSGPSEHWEAAAKHNPPVWGVKEGPIVHIWNRLEPGDVFAAYALSPVSGIIGFGQVVSKQFNLELIWPEEVRTKQSIYPYKIDFSPITPSFNNPSKWPSVRVSAEGLKFYASVNDVRNTEAWLKVVSSASKFWPNLGKALAGTPIEKPIFLDEELNVELEGGVEKAEKEDLGARISLEKDLENFLLTHLEKLEPGMKLVENQLLTDVGKLDILGTDKNSDFMVVELKAGKVGSEVLAQILPYMGWVKTSGEVNPLGKEVRGIIVAHDFDEKVRVAVSSLPNIRLTKYRLNFEFEDIAPMVAK